jgi:transporter family-2 protein
LKEDAMPTTSYALTMLFAGIGIPILAALNAALGGRVGSPVAASVTLFSIALICTLAVFFIGGFKPTSSILAAPKHLFFAGVLVAFYILSITFIAPKFGVGNAVFFVLLGQLISAAAIDHFGLFGAQISPLSITRAGGIALMAGGVYLTQQA